MPIKRDKEAIKPGPVERFQIKWEHAYPPVDLYMNFEKSSWKNQIRRAGFLVYLELDFYCLCSLQKSILKLFFFKLIFAG